MRRVQLTAALLLSFLGCGLLAGCGPKQPAGNPPVMTMPPAVISGHKSVPQRVPTNEIGIRFPYGPNEEVTMLGFSDLIPLARPEVQQALAENLTPWAKEIAGVDAACVSAIVSGAKELLVGSGERGWVFVLSIPDHKLESVCTPNARTEPLAMEHATKAWTFKEEQRACATAPGWLVCGFPELVRQSISASSDGLVPVTLEGDEILTIDDRDPSKDLRFVATSNADRLSGKLDLLFDNDDEARKLHELLARPSEQLNNILAETRPTADQKALLERITKNIVVSHRGPRAMIRVDLTEPLAAQAKDMGDFIGFMATAPRSMKTQSRTEQARAGLDKIAEKLAQAWDSKDPKSPFADHAKLLSLPAVPKTVPKGERVLSPPDSWKAWSAIGWSLETMTHFQFEIIAAKDGQTADIVAHGDLDGDGKVSTFTRHVRIDKSSKQLMIEDIVATDPDE